MRERATANDVPFTPLDKLFDTEIPTSIRVTESSAKGKSIYAYDPDGKAALAYDKLTGEVLANERARDRERRALHAAR